MLALHEVRSMQLKTLIVAIFPFITSFRRKNLIPTENV